MKEPIASITNIFYVIAGAIALYMSYDNHGAAFMMSFTVLGVGSFWYHATLSKIGQAADEIGMYTAFGTLVAIGVSVLIGSHPAIWAPGIMFVFAAMIWDSADSFIVMPILVLSACLLVGLNDTWLHAVAALAIYAAAVAVRALGEQYEDEGREFRYNLCHGLWHFMTAGGALFIFSRYMA